MTKKKLKAKKDLSTTNNIYIREEGVPQERTKAHKRVRGEGAGGRGGGKNLTNLEHTNDPLPKAVGFIYFHENPFKMMNVSYFI